MDLYYREAVVVVVVVKDDVRTVKAKSGNEFMPGTNMDNYLLVLPTISSSVDEQCWDSLN
jgi:hypothetical protein